MRLFAQLSWYFRREWRRYLGAVALLVIIAMLQLVPPKVVGIVVDAANGIAAFVTVVTEMPEVLGFWRMAGEYDYLMRVQVADMKRYDEFYKRLVNSVPGLSDVTSSFAMEQIKYTTSLPIE